MKDKTWVVGLASSRGCPHLLLGLSQGVLYLGGCQMLSISPFDPRVESPFRFRVGKYESSRQTPTHKHIAGTWSIPMANECWEPETLGQVPECLLNVV